MVVLSPAQLAALRSHPQWLQFYMVVHTPNRIGQFTLAMSTDPDETRGAVVLAFDAIDWDAKPWNSALNFSVDDLRAGMTVVASTGERARLKSWYESPEGSGIGVLRVPPNDIPWVDGMVVEVYDVHEPWSIFPRIEVTEEEEDTPLLYIYQDYDVGYTTQANVCRPVVIMGGPVVVIQHQADPVYVDFDGRGSYGLDMATIASYSWKFQGAIPDTSTVANPTGICWTAPGTYTAELTVTDTNGISSTGYRPVIICDETMLQTKFELSGLEGSYNEGTWKATVALRCAQDGTYPEAVHDNAEVIIFAIGKAGDGTTLPIPGNNTDRPNLLFVGWVDGETITKDPFADQITFDVLGTCGKMAKMQEYADTWQVPELTPGPTKWYEMSNPNIDILMLAHLRWRSTILDIVDVHWMNLTSQKNKMRHDFAEGTLLEQCQSLMNMVLGRIGSDKTGAIWMRIEPFVLPSYNNWRENIDTVLTLADTDWQGPIEIKRTAGNACSGVDLGGVWFDGLGNDPEVNAHPVFALAPGDPMGNRSRPLYGGPVEQVDGLVLEGPGAGQACQVCGDIFAWRNNEYPEITLKMAGAWTCLDLFPMEWIAWTIAEDWTRRGISWTNARFLIRNMQIDCDNATGTAVVTITLEKETDGSDAVQIIYPWEPEVTVGTYVDLDSANEAYITVAANASIDDLPIGKAFTIEGWIRVTGVDPEVDFWQTIVDKSFWTAGSPPTSGGPQLSIQYGGYGGYYFYFEATVGCYPTAALTEFPIDWDQQQWFHFAMVYDDTTDRKVHVAINGQWKDPPAGGWVDQAASGTVSSDAACPLRFGVSRSLADGFLKGGIQWLRISNTNRYTYGIGFITPDMEEAPSVDEYTVELWAMDEGSGTVIAASMHPEENIGTLVECTWGQE